MTQRSDRCPADPSNNNNTIVNNNNDEPAGLVLSLYCAQAQRHTFNLLS